MALKPVPSPRSFSAEFADQEVEIARLVAGVPDSPNDWNGKERVVLSNFYKEKLFMSQAVTFLNNRGQPIETAVKDHKILSGANVDRRDINSLSAGEPITLLQCVKVSHACNKLAAHSDEKLRAHVTSQGKACQLPNNSVVASIYWCNHVEIENIRKHLTLAHEELDKVAFGLNNSLFWRLDKGDRDKNGKRFDYRVSLFAADRLWHTLAALLHYFPSKQVSPFVSIPPHDFYFDPKKNIGKKQGRHTVALPFANGNQDQPASTKDLQEIAARAKKLASSKGEKAVKDDYKI